MDESLLHDSVYAGTLLWLAGYLASMAVYFSDLSYPVWGRVVFVLYIPCTAMAAWIWFRGRDLPLQYYAGVGIAWSITALLLDIPFIVLRFSAWQYYTPDVYLYYLLMFLIPVDTGAYIGTGQAANMRDPKIPG